MISKILDYCLVLSTIIAFNTVYTSNISYNGNLMKVSLIIAAICILYKWIKSKITEEAANGFILRTIGWLTAFVLSFAISGIHEGVFNTAVPAFAFYCILTLYLSMDESKQSITKAYCNCMAVIATISIISWLLFTVFRVTEPTSIVLSKWATFDTGNIKKIPSYYNIYFETQTETIFGFEIIRNTGIFIEAPMASFPLCCAILFELTELNARKPVLVVLTLGVLTSISTSGLIFLLMSFLYIIYNKNVNNKQMHNFKIIFTICLTLLVAYIGWSVFIQKTDSVSASIRSDDMLSCIKAWLTSPIFGVGLNNKYVIISNMSQFRAINYGISSSLLRLLAEGGLLFFIPHVYPLFKKIFSGVRFSNFSYIYQGVAYLWLLLNVAGLYMCLPFLGKALLTSTGLSASKDFKQ